MNEPETKMKRVVDTEKFVLELMAQIGARERRMLVYPMTVGAVIFVVGMFLCLDILRNQQERTRYATAGNAPLAGSITITNGSNNSADHPQQPANTATGGVLPVVSDAGREVGAASGGTPKPPSKKTVELKRAALKSVFVKHAGLTPQDQARVDDNCPFGRPALSQTANMPTQLVCRDGYVLLHSNIDKIALWVCEHVTKDEAKGTMERSDNFRPDPLLPKGGRSELADYKKSGYDRGHMAPAGDQNQDERLKDETFFLSNMAPQLGDLNRKIWADLEHDVRQWAIDHGGAHVITGGFFYDPKEDNPETADGSIPYTIIGKNAVSVPTHFYKIVVGKDGSGQFQAIAFVFEHRKHKSPWQFEEQVRPIDWIEEQTGIDFMPELTPSEADRLEKNAGDYDKFFGAD